jgi:two-component system NarL family response regulator
MQAATEFPTTSLTTSHEPAGAPRPIRLALIDDHPILRQGIAALLSARPGFEVAAEAGDGAHAVELYRRHRPDVVLMDVRMPGVDGVTALKALRAEFPGARVLLFTTFDTDEDVYSGMQAGAMGFLLKDAPFESLVEALRSVHAGCRHVPPGIGAKLAVRVMAGDLTAREHEVLREIARGGSNQEIAGALFITEGHRQVPRQPHPGEDGLPRPHPGRHRGRQARPDPHRLRRARRRGRQKTGEQCPCSAE